MDQSEREVERYNEQTAGNVGLQIVPLPLTRAAPDLLAALERLESTARSVADITHRTGIGLDDPILADALSGLWQYANEARAAIAAARGES
jgi:hypothetical protein